ncbi:tyrosine--tRNA ligase [bacterium]|nr:tyrosine--tRNA ligase [bacterium]
MKRVVEEQYERLKENTVNFISDVEFKAKLETSLKTNKPLRIKFGADPTAPDIHLGHTVILNKLRQFQEFGHIVDFIIGDFTAMIGDPSGKSETRKPLSRETVIHNAKTYQDQLFKVKKKKKTIITFNSKWFDTMNFRDVIQLSSHYSVARMLERDDFSKRYTNGLPISIVEFLYPLIQGYDSVMLNADVEMGGTDQTFNLLVGRDLQKAYGQQEQIVLTMPILEGTDGIQKMSKSLGNYIGINEAPKEIFGKIMSISDTLMVRYYRLLTERTAQQVDMMESDIAAGKQHPMDLKKQLAREIITRFYDSSQAEEAHEEFTRVFSHGNLPDDIPQFPLSAISGSGQSVWICSLLKSTHLTASTSEARRMVQQGAVYCNNEKITDPDAQISLTEGMIFKVGKRRYAKITS